MGKRGFTGRREKPANALMVMPPRAEAARPVDAVTKVDSLGKARRMCLSSSDLPVPAQPVKKTLCPSLQRPANNHSWIQRQVRQLWSGRLKGTNVVHM